MLSKLKIFSFQIPRWLLWHPMEIFVYILVLLCESSVLLVLLGLHFPINHFLSF